MPIYEYVCEECHHKFDKLVRTSGVAVMVNTADCPECHNTSRRVPSSFASIMSSQGAQTLPMSDAASAGGCACGGNCGCGAG